MYAASDSQSIFNKRICIISNTNEGSLPVITADGTVVPAASLADIQMTAGPVKIRHRERVRTVTLIIRPAPGVALESAMDTIREQVVAPLAAEIPPDVKLSLSGTARELDRTWEAMQWQLAIALAVVYLVMAVMFESFLYPLIIVFSVPLATAGAVIGLTRAFRPLPAGSALALGALLLLAFSSYGWIAVFNGLLAGVAIATLFTWIRDRRRAHA